MVFVPADLVYQAKVYGTLMGQDIMNVLNFVSVDNVRNDSVLANSIATTVYTKYASGIVPSLTTEYTLRGVEVKYMGVADGVVGQHLAVTYGGNTSPPLPGNVAFCISFTTGFSGRSRRGRIYIGGLSENQSDGSYIAQSYANTLTTGMTVLANEVQADNTCHLCVVSNFSNGAQRTEALVTPVLSIAPRNLRLDSMRSRLP